jgi:hypothetical protein
MRAANWAHERPSDWARPMGPRSGQVTLSEMGGSEAGKHGNKSERYRRPTVILFDIWML